MPVAMWLILQIVIFSALALLGHYLATHEPFAPDQSASKGILMFCYMAGFVVALAGTRLLSSAIDRLRFGKPSKVTAERDTDLAQSIAQEVRRERLQRLSEPH